MSGVIDTTEYVIRTRFETSPQIPGLGDITRRLGGIEQQISGIGSSITRSIGGAFAGLASIQGLASATRGIIGLHTEVQNAEMGIASLVSALTDTSMADSLGLSRGLMKGLQQDAAKGAGSFNDYAKGFQSIMAGGLQAGAGLDEIREVNRLAMTAGFALRGQEGLGLVGFDVQQAMTQGVGERTTPIVNQALRSIGVASEKFNKMTAPEKWRTLTSAFGSFEAAAKEMGKTWDAQSSTFVDGLKSLVREGSENLFAAWTDDLVKANEWLAKNHDLLVRSAGLLGSKVAGAYGAARDNATGVASSGVGLAAAGVGMRGGMALAGAGLLSGPGLLLAGGIALFAGFVGAAVTTALATFQDLREYVAGSFGAFVEAVMGVGVRLARFASSPVMAWMGGAIAGTIGFFLNVMTLFLRGLNTFTDLAALGVDTWVEGMLAAKSLLSGDLEGAKFHKDWADSLQGQASDLFMRQFDDMKILDGLTGNGKPPGFGGVPTGDEVGKLGNVKDPGPTNIYGDVRVEVKAERLDDPAMAATSFEKAMDYLRQNPKGSSAPRLVPRPT